jgi:hypothetical protein
MRVKKGTEGRKMLNFKSVIALIIALLIISFAVGAAPALAGGMSVDPTWGNKDTTYSVSVEGFNKNERVSTWIQQSNGTVLSLGEVKAGSDGSVEFSVSPDSSWSYGEVIVVAHGLSSQKEFSAKFNIAPSGEEAAEPETSGSLVASSVDGLTLTFYGSGYAAGERVATWFQYPSELGTSTAHALGDVYADSAGKVRFDFTVGRDWEFGGYHIAAQGAQSKHVTFNTFSFFGTLTDQYTYWTSSANITSPTWHGQYWNNIYMDGSPALVRQDAAIRFDWGEGSPGSQIGVDTFSARWDATATVSGSGYYLVTATADDGIRVWVDGSLVIDQWQDQSAATFSKWVYLDQGQHTLTVEYYELYGDAVAKVWIEAE